MKKRTILCAVLLCALLCGVLAACGTQTDGRDRTTTTATNRVSDDTTRTTAGDFGDMMSENAETMSEMFSEDASELRERSFLDPQNGIISDTQTNP